MRRLPPGAPILTAAAMRAAEEAMFARGVSQDALVAQAGAAIARETARLAAGRAVLVLAGPGNNGGDAWVAARLLDAMGVDVAVATLGTAKDGAAARAAAGWRGGSVALTEAGPRPVLLDGLLGIGTPRPFVGPEQAAIDALLAAADLRIAIDLPSGIDSDSGVGGIAVDVTIALGALKPAHLLGAGCGHVLLDTIGIDADRRWTSLAPPAALPRRHDVNKFTRGMVVAIGGAMPGAGWLAASAAMLGGAGYVMLAGHAPEGGAPHALVRRTIDGADDLAKLLDDDRVGAVVIGPGLGRDATARKLLDVALASSRDLVIDGDALTLLGADVTNRIRADWRAAILTPHSGEFDRMFGTTGSKIDRTIAAAARSGAVVVHKGPATVIAAPDGRVVVGAGASGALASAGTGDVLAGLAAAQRAAGRAPFDAAAAAVWLHTRAAALAGPALIADDLIANLGQAIAQCPIPTR